MTTTDVLLQALRSHIGRAHGITAKALVIEINHLAGDDIVSERELRQLVVVLRKDGHHVCAHPKDGYFLAKDSDELAESCNYLTTRALCSLEQVAAMKRVSLPDLFGQMHLPT